MIVSSHQPLFFPWLGYLDKMAKADIFLINDIAQLERKSPMTRTKMLAEDGTAVTVSVPIASHGIMKSENREVELADFEQTRRSLLGKIRAMYRKTVGFEELWPTIEELLGKDYVKLIDLNVATISFLREQYAIKTPIKYHSALEIADYSDNKSENIAKKCLAVGAEQYLSGNGARKYMELDIFKSSGIAVAYQVFAHPTYPQGIQEFVPNLSALDMLFHLGIKQARELFWQNVAEEEVYE